MIRQRIVQRAVLGVVLLLALGSAAPADPAPPRPRIGLVLSGGGARGAAHVGVIRVLEEMRVPIDCIAGTSVGSIVGALYAIGQTPDEIEATLATIDWGDVFSDPPHRRARSFRRKRDDDSFLIRNKPGFNRLRIQLPSGLLQGQNLDLELSRHLLASWDAEDFDALGIPFRSVAADLLTAEQVVLGSGSLPAAVRASMNIPIVFAPIEIDGRHLVDGGLLNNVPVDVVRAMGADIVIAVDIATPLAGSEALASPMAVGSQLSGFLTRGQTEVQIATLTARDLLIVPDLHDFKNSDFPLFAQIIPRGEQAAEALRERLDELSLTEAAYAAYRESVAPAATDPPVIEFVRIDNDSRLSDAAIRSSLGNFPLGEPLDLEDLERRINGLYGLELFENVRYRVVRAGQRAGLEVELRDRTWGPNYLQFGAAYDANSRGSSVLGLAVAYLRTAMNSAGGEWRTTGILGEDAGIESEWYQPLWPGASYFVAPFLRYGQRLEDGFDGDDLTAEFTASASGWALSSGRVFDPYGEFRIGVRRGEGRSRVRVGGASIPESDFSTGSAFVRLSYDMLDDIGFPTSGGAVVGEMSLARSDLGSDADFDQLQVRGLAAASRGRSTVALGVEWGVTTAGRAEGPGLFRLGGFLNLSGFTEDELSGQNLGRLSLLVYRQLPSHWLLPTYVGLGVERGNVWERREDVFSASSIWSGTAWVAVDTQLGPIHVGYGHAEAGSATIYFALGHSMF